ncbi:hypothetical protein C8Q69DRAFT_158078 [Paecilomyces variotii]|uniref:Uncharacterized protein n=1 Tax=Byssochlamys spectabilis TaxID=264951 RepID=A0A443I1W1_BYSSP|nr:hypothetical protein C8Q69DRAFT_158078 [Paecilomyces variotii]RWQ98046.1 hypothetical protein C8Q69DRAFT_158078 [Paecilomyces variotii]
MILHPPTMDLPSDSEDYIPDYTSQSHYSCYCDPHSCFLYSRKSPQCHTPRYREIIQTWVPYLYTCCQCEDGPKAYDSQPRCIVCNHSVCSQCTHVR